MNELPSVDKRHRQARPLERADRIKRLALAHPAYGCNRLQAIRSLRGWWAASITI